MSWQFQSERKRRLPGGAGALVEIQNDKSTSKRVVWEREECGAGGGVDRHESK